MDLLWDKTFHNAMMFARNQRNPAGGWFEDDSGKAAPLAAYTFAFAEMANQLNWRFVTAGQKTPPASPLIDEALWGAEALLKSAPLKDEPLALQAAALARAARIPVIGKQHPQYEETARKLLRESLQKEKADPSNKDPMQFNAAMDLYAISEAPADKTLAGALYPGANAECIEALILYDDVFEPQQPSVVRFMVSVEKEFDEHVKAAANPFAIIATPSYFGTTDKAASPIGNTGAVLGEAARAARAFRFVSKPEVYIFVLNQFNWILGANPAGLCLMAGIAGTQTPSFATKTSPDKLVGAIANGFTGRGPGDDRPFIDNSGGPNARATAGVELHNTVDWLRALACIKRIRSGSTRGGGGK
jgi:hypothetical protein